MSEAIIVALIAAAASILGQLLIGRKNTSEMFAKLDKQSELSDAEIKRVQDITNTKLDDLTREVRAHNEFAKRIPILETKVEIIEKKVGV